MHKKITKYLDFKIGEVWVEISDELAFEGIRPISPDQECIETVKEIFLGKVEGVRQKQLEFESKLQDVRYNVHIYFLDWNVLNLFGKCRLYWKTKLHSLIEYTN